MKYEKKSTHIWIGETKSSFIVDMQGDINIAKLYFILKDIENKIFEENKNEIYSYVQEQERQNLQS